MNEVLQATTRTVLSKNEGGIEHGVESYHPVDAYRSVELEPASLSSVNRGEVSGVEGSRGGNKARGQWERARRTKEKLQDRLIWAVAQGVPKALSALRPRGALLLCARGCPLEKTVLTGGPAMAVTQGGAAWCSTGIKPGPLDDERTDQIREGVRTGRKGYAIWTVDLQSDGRM